MRLNARRLYLGLSLAGLCACALWWGRTTLPGRHEPREDAFASNHGADGMALVEQEARLHRPDAPVAGKREAESPAHVDWRRVVQDTKVDASFESFDDEARAILAEDRFLAVFTHYRKHVLLDERGRQNYRAILSSREALELTRDELLYPDEKEVTYKGNVERLMRIEVFKEALAWQENPAREYILDMMEEMLLEDNLLADLGREMHRSLAANKMELFELLYQHAPERTAGILEQSQGGRLEKLIEYIVRETERTTALERAGTLSPG